MQREEKGEKSAAVDLPWPSGGWWLEAEGQGKEEVSGGNSTSDVCLLWPLDHSDKPAKKAGLEPSSHFGGQESCGSQVGSNRVEMRTQVSWSPAPVSSTSLWMETLRNSLGVRLPSCLLPCVLSKWSWGSHLKTCCEAPFPLWKHPHRGSPSIAFHCSSLLAGHPVPSIFPATWYSPAARAFSKTHLITSLFCLKLLWETTTHQCDLINSGFEVILFSFLYFSLSANFYTISLWYLCNQKKITHDFLKSSHLSKIISRHLLQYRQDSACLFNHISCYSFCILLKFLYHLQNMLYSLGTRDILNYQWFLRYFVAFYTSEF